MERPLAGTYPLLTEGMELLPVAVLLSPGRGAVEARWLARPGHGRAAALGKEPGPNPPPDCAIQVTYVGRARHSLDGAKIQNGQKYTPPLREALPLVAID